MRSQQEIEQMLAKVILAKDEYRARHDPAERDQYIGLCAVRDTLLYVLEKTQTPFGDDPRRN